MIASRSLNEEVGNIKMFPLQNFPTDQYLLCNGNTYPESLYPRLFNRLFNSISSLPVYGPVTYTITNTVTDISSADGFVSELAYSTWSEALAGTGANSASENYYIVMDYHNNYQITRGFMYFDLSGALPIIQSTVTSAVLHFYVLNGTNTYGPVNGSKSFIIQQGTQGSSLQNSDFGAFTGNSFGTCSLSFGTDGYCTNSGWHTITLNSDGLKYINNTLLQTDHKALFCMRTLNDYTGITDPPPTINNQIMIYSGSESSYQPYIVLSYNVFNVPNYLGYFLRGQNGGSGNDPDWKTRILTPGSVVHDFVGTTQQDAIIDHLHSASLSAESLKVDIGSGSDYPNDPYPNTPSSLPVDDSDVPITNMSEYENRPKNIYVVYAIKAY